MQLNFKDIVSIFFKKKKIVDFTLCFVLFYNCNCFFSQYSFNDRNKDLSE